MIIVHAHNIIDWMVLKKVEVLIAIESWTQKKGADTDKNRKIIIGF